MKIGDKIICLVPTWNPMYNCDLKVSNIYTIKDINSENILLEEVKLLWFCTSDFTLATELSTSLT
jgi:hypothetical protein